MMMCCCGWRSVTCKERPDILEYTPFIWIVVFLLLLLLLVYSWCWLSWFLSVKSWVDHLLLASMTILVVFQLLILYLQSNSHINSNRLTFKLLTSNWNSIFWVRTSSRSLLMILTSVSLSTPCTLSYCSSSFSNYICFLNSSLSNCNWLKCSNISSLKI